MAVGATGEEAGTEATGEEAGTTATTETEVVGGAVITETAAAVVGEAAITETVVEETTTTGMARAVDTGVDTGADTTAVVDIKIGEVREFFDQVISHYALRFIYSKVKVWD